MNININNNIKKRNTYSGLAISSLAIGVLELIVMFLLVLFSLIMSVDSGPGINPPALYYIIVICVDIAGLVFGIYGIFSEKKRVALAGLILCASMLIPYMFYVLLLNDVAHINGILVQ
jgi:hypothetical protein